ncbi:unnamed protein product [Nezara viridula]|uniref:Uncharacterized protein n=1 Tax=Nezara viridula TaxID=85310 RepID=A0A9P0HFQ6_NEZVI|nr:unnamed protein product [Nezara viridula]
MRGLWFGSRGTIPKRTRSFLEELGVDIKDVARLAENIVLDSLGIIHHHPIRAGDRYDDEGAAGQRAHAAVNRFPNEVSSRAPRLARCRRFDSRLYQMSGLEFPHNPG